MIKVLPISGFADNLPENQLLEESYKNIIKKNYSMSGFTPIDTPVVERLDILTSKGADDNEIYGLHRINGQEGDDSGLGLRFDLTVPLARYIAMYEGELIFPFKRQHIARVYRGERPQKGRYREFYQADIDIIGNGKLPIFADVEILSTIYNSLLELDFGAFCININNKKFLEGFLESISIKNTVEIISLIDKKDKIKSDKLKQLFLEKGINENQISKIMNFIKISDEKTNIEILDYFKSETNTKLLEGLEELSSLYINLINLGIKKDFIKINTSISRGLNYYTGTVFETFISGKESMGSISSGGRYENLCGNFTKNSYPGVGGSIGLSRLIAVLNSIGKFNPKEKTTSKVLVLNMGLDTLKNNLEIVSSLRKNNIATEIYLDESKMQKQIKYANNKGIKYVIICGTNEIENGIIVLKNLETGEQFDLEKDKLLYHIK